MKFGALLRTSAGEVTELQELFAAYKKLKKHLKRLPDKEALKGGSAAISPTEAEAWGATEADFVAALSRDISQFNDMYLEREEDAVIQLRSLQDLASPCQSATQLENIYRKFVDFHGEMLLLVHWSILAYTGMVKILKKHHKRTGLLVKAPHLDNLAGQPFCSTELMSELVRKAEADIDALRSRLTVCGSSAQSEAHHLEASHSEALLQAAQLRRSSGSGVLSTMTQGNITASAAQQLMAAVSDSGSAPSAASEASDAETRPVNRPALPDKGYERSSVCAGYKRRQPEAASSQKCSIKSPRRHRCTAQQSLSLSGPPGVNSEPQPQRTQNTDSDGCNGIASATMPVAAAGYNGRNAEKQQCRAHQTFAAACTPIEKTCDRSPGTAGASQGNPFFETHLMHQEELQQQQVEMYGAVEHADSVAGGSPSSLPSGDMPPTMLQSTSQSVHSVRHLSEPLSDRDSSGAPAAPERSLPICTDWLRYHTNQQEEAHASANGPRILAQTQAALGLWRELTETASTPSTVLPRHIMKALCHHPASSVGTDQSAT